MENPVIRPIIAAALLLGAIPAAQASPGTQGQACIARVIKSVELPFGPLGTWKVQVTLQITPPGGVTHATNMALQTAPPCGGQANPTTLRLI